jgi:hypothetical protein
MVLPRMLWVIASLCGRSHCVVCCVCDVAHNVANGRHVSVWMVAGGWWRGRTNILMRMVMRIILTGGRWAHCAAADCVSVPIPCGAFIHATNAHAPPPGETGESPYTYIPSPISTTHHPPGTPLVNYHHPPPPGPTGHPRPHHPTSPTKRPPWAYSARPMTICPHSTP